MRLLAAIREVIAEAPLFTPTMPRSGKPMWVRMTNCGPLGWVTDKERGYRYQATHPVTGRPWPPCRPRCSNSGGASRAIRRRPRPASSIIMRAPPRWACTRTRTRRISPLRFFPCRSAIPAIFRVGGRRAKTRRANSSCGRAMWWCLAAQDRLAFHGIDRILAGTSDLLPEGGRFNLTLRRVTKPA